MSNLVSVVIPALNEQSTVGRVVEAVRADDPFEVIVIDNGSTDDTVVEALRAGADVISWSDVLPGIPPVPGKGEVLWRGVAAASGDIVVFADADLRDPKPDMINRLVQPFDNEEIQLVKAYFDRPLGTDPYGGGRVTELTAKPLLRALYPELSHIKQPLAGEYAIRKSAAEVLPFVTGYGVEIGLLIDVAARFGAHAIGQVQLGRRPHRNRTIAELSPMADIVAQTIVSRAGMGVQPDQRPPLVDVKEYQTRV